jgi:ATP dependent DNA ligase-like protein
MSRRILRYRKGTQVFLRSSRMSATPEALKKTISVGFPCEPLIAVVHGAHSMSSLRHGTCRRIGGYTPSVKNFDALIFGYYEANKLIYVASIRNGFMPWSREQLFKSLKALQIAECRFTNLSGKQARTLGSRSKGRKNEKCRWLKPVLVGQFEYIEWTPDETCASYWTLLKLDEPTVTSIVARSDDIARAAIWDFPGKSVIISHAASFQKRRFKARSRVRSRVKRKEMHDVALTAGIRGSTPLGTGHLNAPDRAANVERLVCSDECRRSLVDHPDFRIGWLFAYQRRNHSSDAADLNLHHKKGRFVTSPSDCSLQRK